MRNLKFIDKIIIVGVVCMAIFIVLIFFAGKRANRDFYIPEHFQGWVKIKHGTGNSSPLEKKDGAYQIYIPDSGYLETSTLLSTGWGRDRFFFIDTDGSTELIPNYINDNGEEKMLIHGKSSFPISHEHLLSKLPDQADTTLWDETKITKSGGRVIYTPGKRLLEYFYICSKPQPLTFYPPLNEDPEMLKSTEDREVKLEDKRATPSTLNPEP